MGNKLRKEDAKYIVVPIAGTFTSWSVRTGLSWLLWNNSELTSFQGGLLGVIGWACAVAVTYAISRLFVFKSNKPFVKEIILYVRNRVGTMVIESFMMALLTGTAILSASTSSLISSAFVIILNWVLTRSLMLQKGK